MDMMTEDTLAMVHYDTIPTNIYYLYNKRIPYVTFGDLQ